MSFDHNWRTHDCGELGGAPTSTSTWPGIAWSSLAYRAPPHPSPSPSPFHSLHPIPFPSHPAMHALAEGSLTDNGHEDWPRARTVLRETGGAHAYWDHYSLVKNWSDTASAFETKPSSRLRVITNVSVGVQMVASPSDTCALGSGASWSVEAGSALNLLGGGHLHCGSEVRVDSSGVLEIGSSGPASSVTMWDGAAAIGNGTVRYTGRHTLEPAAHAIYATLNAPNLRLELERGVLVRVSPNMSSTALPSTYSSSPSSSLSPSASLNLNGLMVSAGATLMLLRSHNGSIPEQSTDYSAQTDDDGVPYIHPTPVLAAKEIAVRSGGLLVAPSSPWRLNATNVTVSGATGGGGRSASLWCV